MARAAAHAVPTAVFARSDYPDRPARDAAMADWLQERGARLVVLAGYMELIGAPFLERFPNAVINVHPSLLPAFPGLRAVQQALDYGVKVFGVTVHFVDGGVDSGPVILQGSLDAPRRRTTPTRYLRRCARSSTRCCPRPCGCSPTRLARPATPRPRAGVHPRPSRSPRAVGPGG